MVDIRWPERREGIPVAADLTAVFRASKSENG
jgi:hypothetical protein